MLHLGLPPSFFYLFFFIWHFLSQVSAVCCQQLPPTQKPTRLSIPDTTSQSSHVPRGKLEHGRLGSGCSAEGNQLLCCLASMSRQEHRRGKGGKLTGNYCQNAHMMPTHGREEGEDDCREEHSSKCTEMWHSVTVTHWSLMFFFWSFFFLFLFFGTPQTM